MESSEKHVYVFYHIFCNDNTAAIVKDQCLRIIFSRLYERVDAVYCFLVGQESKIVEVEKLIANLGKKFRIAVISYSKLPLFHLFQEKIEILILI